MSLKSKILLISLILSVSFCAGVTKAGFGISPPSLINKNLVPGSYFEETIYLVQNNPTEVLHATVTINADKIKDWIKIENGNSFDIPKGVQQFPMKVQVTVPSTAAFDHYTGSITVNTKPDTNPGGVQVTLGGEINISLDVTSIKVSDFSIQNFQVLDTAKGSPIKFVVKVKNDGNVDNGPTKVSLTFFDEYHSKQLGQEEKNITDKVKSFQTKDLSVDFANNLDVGSYWADVKIYSDDKEVVNSKLVFAVLSPDAVKKGFSLPTIPPWIYIAVVGLIVLVLLVVIFKKLFKKKGIKVKIKHEK